MNIAVENSSFRDFIETPVRLSKTKQAILIAISTIMAVGMLFSYALGAPWIITVGLFALMLAPLFPLWKIFNPHSDRITE